MRQHKLIAYQFYANLLSLPSFIVAAVSEYLQPSEIEAIHDISPEWGSLFTTPQTRYNYLLTQLIQYHNPKNPKCFKPNWLYVSIKDRPKPIDISLLAEYPEVQQSILTTLEKIIQENQTDMSLPIKFWSHYQNIPHKWLEQVSPHLNLSPQKKPKDEIKELDRLETYKETLPTGTAKDRLTRVLEIRRHHIQKTYKMHESAVTTDTLLSGKVPINVLRQYSGKTDSIVTTLLQRHTSTASLISDNPKLAQSSIMHKFIDTLYRVYKDKPKKSIIKKLLKDQLTQMLGQTISEYPKLSQDLLLCYYAKLIQFQEDHVIALWQKAKPDILFLCEMIQHKKSVNDIWLHYTTDADSKRTPKDCESKQILITLARYNFPLFLKLAERYTQNIPLSLLEHHFIKNPEEIWPYIKPHIENKNVSPATLKRAIDYYVRLKKK